MPLKKYLILLRIAREKKIVGDEAIII